MSRLRQQILDLLSVKTGLSSSEIANQLCRGHSGVHRELLRCEKAGLVWWKQNGPGETWLWELT